MKNNLNETSSTENSNREIMKNEIKEKCKSILEKYFEDREYNKDKVNIWKNYALEEISNFVSTKYKDFGFVICIFLTSGLASSNNLNICDSETDNSFVISIKKTNSKTIYSEFRICFYKINNLSVNFIKNIEEDILLEMDNLLYNKLDGKKYSSKEAKIFSIEIAQDLNDYLFKRKKPLPSSFNAIYIFPKPIKISFGYKIINLDYIPFFSSYSNDFLCSKFVLFILNN